MAVCHNGVLTLEELKARNDFYPSEERMRKGPVAVAECVEEIPCNPCETACKFGGIRVGDPITNLPVVDGDVCTGCGLCVPHCSGMAIFILDKSYSDTVGSVAFPYEYQRVLDKGDVVDAVDREGKVVCMGTVLKTVSPKLFDRTTVVTLEVPMEFVEVVRGVRIFDQGEARE